MKKSILITLLLTQILRGSFFAQNTVSLTLTPSSQTTSVNKDSSQVILKAKLKNVSPRAKTVIWTRSFQQITSGWTCSVCDKNACWIPSVQTQPLNLAAGEESNLDVYIYPNGFVGAAIVNVRVVDQDSAANNVTGRYGFNLPVATQDLKNTFPDIQIYPNPTPQYFSIKNEGNMVSEAVIFDIKGREVAVFKQTNGQLSVANLPIGTYFVTLFGLEKQVIKVVELVKL